MASMEKELEELLLEAGNRLLSPPSSVDELLPLLDQVESCLSKVEQSPTNSMRTALCPSMKALVADELLRHSDMDVKVTVASCISEITRITAPDAPYDDELMKEIFQLIVVAFEKLFDTSNRSYSKRVSILETVAKVRSCVVMLDLECDALILEMFQHFLKAIRDDHPDNVFSSMETIMTLVLEESEDISLELLSPLLNSVKKDNQDVLPIAQKLGEKVIENCTAKLKPYMMQAVQSLGISFNDYSTVVASICQETSNTVDHNDSNISGKHLADESKLLEKSGLDDQSQVAKELLPEEAGPGSVDPTVDKSPQSVMSNGTAQTGNSDSLVDPNSLKKKLERSRRANQSKSTDASTKTEPDNLDSEKVIKSETKPDPATKKTRGRKPNPLLNSSQVSDRSRIDREKENVELPDRRKSRGKDADSATSEGLSTKEAAVLSENEKEAQTQLSSPTTSPVEAVNVASPSPNQVLPDGNRSRKGRRVPKKKGSINDEADPGSPSVPRGALLGDHVDDQTPPSPDVILKKESEHTSDAETKPHKRLGKKALAGNPNEKTPTPVDIVMKKESGSTSDSGVKPLKKSGMKVDPIDANEDESSAKQHEGTRKRGRGKTVSDKDVVGESGKKKMASSSKSAPKSSNKDQSQLVETPRTKSKRKLTPGKEEASEVPHGVKDFGENLVGSKIKVWWPDDEMFYEGHIESFDPVEKKHKVLYVDGDEETLTLNTERWEFVRDGNVADGELATDLPSPDASSEMHVKKKAKTNSDSLNKHAKPNVSLKRAGGAAKSETGKSKSGATKSGGKSKDDGKLNSKSKDDTPKIANKSKDDSGSKTKDDTPKTGNKSKGVHTTPSKSKDDSPKISTKSKDDSIKSGTKSKGETPKTTSKSSANGTTAKGKSSKSKVQESEDSAKGRSDPAKAQESKTKSGKKRGRRVSS